MQNTPRHRKSDIIHDDQINAEIETGPNNKGTFTDQQIWWWCRVQGSQYCRSEIEKVKNPVRE